MKEEIRRIIDMHKAGQLSDEQATELLAALAEGGRREQRAGDAKGSTTGSRSGNAGDWSRTIRSVANEFLGENVGKRLSEALSGIKSHDDKGNQITMSRYEAPVGEDFSFSGNSVQVSALSAIQLDRSQMDENSFNAARLSDFQVTDSSFCDCSVNGSSIDHWTSANSEMSELRFNGAKASKVHVDDSDLQGLKLNGASVRNLRFESSQFTDCGFNGISFSDALFLGCEASDVRMDGVGIHGSTFDKVTMNNCHWQKVKIKNSHLRNLALDHVRLDDVSIVDKDFDGQEAFDTWLRGIQAR